MLKTSGFYDRICGCAVFARNTTILETARKSSNMLSKCKRKTPCHGSSDRRSKKHRFGGPKSLQKTTPEASGSLGHLLRATSAPRALQKRSWRALKKAFKTKETLRRNFANNCQKSGSDLGGSAEEAGPVKAFLADRPKGVKVPFQTRSHRKRWSADF